MPVTSERTSPDQVDIEKLPLLMNSEGEIRDFVDQCAASGMSDNRLKYLIRNASKKIALLQLRGPS
jgi:hypothetical protein